MEERHISLIIKSKLPASAKMVLTAMIYRATWPQGLYFSSNAALADDSGLDIRSVQRWLRHLEAGGLIARVCRHRNGVTHRIDVPALARSGRKE